MPGSNPRGVKPAAGPGEPGGWRGNEEEWEQEVAQNWVRIHEAVMGDINTSYSIQTTKQIFFFVY